MCTGETIHPRYSALCPFTVKTAFNQRNEALGTGLTNREALERCQSFCSTTKSRTVCIPSEDKPSDRQKFDPFAYACVLQSSKRDDTSELPNATEACTRSSGGGGYTPNPTIPPSPPTPQPEVKNDDNDKQSDDKGHANGPPASSPPDEDASQEQRTQNAYCSKIDSQAECSSDLNRNRCKWSALFGTCDSKPIAQKHRAVDACAKLTEKGIDGCNIRGCKWNSFGDACSPSWKVDLIVSAIVLVPFMVFIAILYTYRAQLPFMGGVLPRTGASAA